MGRRTKAVIIISALLSASHFLKGFSLCVSFAQVQNCVKALIDNNADTKI